MELVSRVRDAADRRHVTARITPKGRRLLTQATPDLELIERKRCRHLDPRAVASLVSTLEEIREPA